MNSDEMALKLLRSAGGARAVLGILIDRQVNSGSCAPRAPRLPSLATLQRHFARQIGLLLMRSANCARAVLGILIYRLPSLATLQRHFARRMQSLLCATLLATVTVTVPAAEPTWRTVEDMSAEDQALFDPATSTPRDASLPYIPAEPYPFEAPYTAEEMGFRSAEFIHVSRWPHVMLDVFGVVTPSGYISQGEWVNYAALNARPGLEGYMRDVTGGDTYSRWMTWASFPPEQEGEQQYWAPFRTDKEFRTKMDFFVYSPAMRRVRRMPEPRRDQRFPDNAQTFDDVIGRDPWEFEWQLLGTDVLYETLRFPNTRPTMTLNVVGRGFVEKPTSEIRLMGDDFPHYRADGGVECWVLKATAKPEWLPGYAEQYLVVWLEKHTFYPLRREKYAPDGHLMMIEERISKLENPALGDRGYAALMSNYWNIDYDLLGFSLHDGHTLREWSDEEKEMIFSAEFMRREWNYEPLKTQARVSSPDQVFMRPHLYPDKFPAHRNPALPPAVAARYQAQEAAGKLVFETPGAGE